MRDLFDKTEINGLELKNRFIRSATWEGMAGEAGESNDKLAKLLGTLAAGGIGLIIISHAYVDKRGQASPRQLGIYADDLIPGLRKMADIVHEEGAKIIGQLAHGGMVSPPELTGSVAFGPSQIAGLVKHPVQEMSSADITAVADSFACAAKRAKDAGFDGVQIHAAHGYLLSQFLSPALNLRSDNYGRDNRAQIIVDIIKKIRESTGAGFPLMIKMNSRDFLKDGLELKESVEAAKRFEKAGIDLIELSGGTTRSMRGEGPSRSSILSAADEAYFGDAAAVFKEKISVPLSLVGGIRSFQVAEQIIRENIADYISLCRPLIREPGLILRWQGGDPEKSDCISCNRCFVPAMRGQGLFCMVKK